MLFTLSKLFVVFIEPDVLLLAAILIGLSLGRTRWARKGRLLAGSSATLLLLIAVVPVGDWLLAPLEQRFPRPPERPAHVDGIIVLGGAINPEMTALYGIPSLNRHAERMTAFVALARLYPSAKLVFTGGSGSIIPGRPPEADGAQQLLGELGVDPSRVIFERRSRNTYENAIFSKELVQPKPGEVWILVTSAMHLPRAVGIFRRAGWPVIAWPVDYETGSAYDIGFGHLNAIELALHEWSGLLAYRLLGRTDALFPAP